MQCKKEQTDKIISTIQKNCRKDENSYKEEIKEQIKIEDLDDDGEDEFEEEIVYDEDE